MQAEFGEWAEYSLAVRTDYFISLSRENGYSAQQVGSLFLAGSFNLQRFSSAFVNLDEGKKAIWSQRFNVLLDLGALNVIAAFQTIAARAFTPEFRQRY